MTITKRYTTTFTASALGYSMATKLANSYAENGWDVDIKTTTNCILVDAFWAGCFGEEGETESTSFKETH